jgi:hypothetical protein
MYRSLIDQINLIKVIDQTQIDKCSISQTHQLISVRKLID